MINYLQTIARIGRKNDFLCTRAVRVTRLFACKQLSSEAVGENLVKSLLFGSESEQKTFEAFKNSYSQTLMRGKYVHEITKHQVHPDCVPEYEKLISKLYPMLMSEKDFDVKLFGSWETIFGDLDTFVHIWEYEGYKGYDETIQKIQNNSEFKSLMNEIRKQLVSRSCTMNQEFAFWRTMTPMQLGGIFELRTYDLKPGCLLEWEQYWRKGLECRKQVMQPIGAWFSQLGKLHVVHHLWHFKNLRHRKECRDKCWQVPGWADTVHKTVPLVLSMETNIMKALPFSPIR